MKRVFVILTAVLGLVACAGDNIGPGVPDSILMGGVPGAQSLHLGANRLDATQAHLSVVAEVAGSPKTRLTALTIAISGKRLECGTEMLATLTEPHWLSAATAGEKRYVIIAGRDAGESYIAVFTIEGGWISERLVAHGEFRHQIWNRTIYHDDIIQHPERYKDM